MADRPLVLCHPLCFLFSKINKYDTKLIKTVLSEFYKPEDITVAKELLLEHVIQLSIDSLSRIPRRRDSEGRCLREVDDIFNIIETVDNAKLLLNLPRFVSDSPESMPSIHLVEGDLRAVMHRFDKIDAIIDHLEGGVHKVVSAITTHGIQQSTSQSSAHSIRQPTPQAAAAAPSNVNNEGACANDDFVNEPVPTHAGGRPIPASLQDTMKLTREWQQFQQQNERQQEKLRQQQQRRDYGYDWPIPDWAIMPTTNPYDLLSTESGSSSCDDVNGVGSWELASSRRHKRRRNQSRLQGKSGVNPTGSSSGPADYSLPPPRQPPGSVRPIGAVDPSTAAASQINGRSHEQEKSTQPVMENTRNYAAAVTKQGTTGDNYRGSRQRRALPMLIGRKKSLQSNEDSAVGIAAAKPYIGKKVFCIDNVEKHATVEAMTRYVQTKLGVNVLSCYQVKPRRTRWQIENDVDPDRVAFRLCIPREECQRLMNVDLWPAHIAITPWQFRTRKSNEVIGTEANGAVISGSLPAAASTPGFSGSSTSHGTQAAARSDVTTAAVDGNNSNDNETFHSPNGAVPTRLDADMDSTITE